MVENIYSLLQTHSIPVIKPVFFEDNDAVIKMIILDRRPDHETCFPNFSRCARSVVRQDQP